MAAIIREEGYSESVRIWSRGVDIELFDPRRRSLPWRRSLGIGDDEVVVNFTGRLVKEKNTGLLTRIFAALKPDGVPFRAVIVGDGPEERRMKGALPDAVFTGFLHGEELSRAYASSDVFLFPSESETFGNVTLEAMASGLPTVCADASGSRSLVIEGTTGFLVGAGNEAGFRTRLGALVGGSDLRTRMGNEARARALTFAWDDTLAKLLVNYHEVVAATGALAHGELGPAPLLCGVEKWPAPR